jgi:hypothetical protein
MRGRSESPVIIIQPVSQCQLNSHAHTSQSQHNSHAHASQSQHNSHAHISTSQLGRHAPTTRKKKKSKVSRR